MAVLRRFAALRLPSLRGPSRPLHGGSCPALRAVDGGTALATSDHDEGPALRSGPAHPPDENPSNALTPAKVVELLDRFIVGQADAKRAVAVALRNRWRRHKIDNPMREDIVPKNILMIGPTGCGKTEIARRLAKLADAPFVKVEATKFTEVGFHGRDVDQIIRDLVENAILLQRQKMRTRMTREVEQVVENRILELLAGSSPSETDEGTELGTRKMREMMRAMLREGKLDNQRIQLDISDSRTRVNGDMSSAAFALAEVLTKFERAITSPKAEKRDISVGEARPLLMEMEMEKNLSTEQITKEAVRGAESDGIVFIDEIDKIVTSSESRHGADASSEGVQRDLLPIIEGSTVSTKYGNVNTDHVLFICSGAFHSCRPSDMLAELQGRLPIRVELKGLTQQDLYRILTEPETNMLRQQQMLMATENIDLVFTDAAIHELAAVASEVNKSVDNIGARRLHTVLEKVVEDISFHAPERAGQRWVIDAEDVKKAVRPLLKRTDLSKFVL